MPARIASTPAAAAGDQAPGHRPWAWLAFVAAVTTAVFAAVLNWPRDTAAEPAGPTRTPGATATAAARPRSHDCSGGSVYLTFDDGPGPGTAPILDQLATFDLKATFFVIGDHITGNEGLIRREVAAGHSVQNHSYHHFDLVTGVDLTGTRRYPWGASEIETELLRTNRAITEAGAPPPTEYRPPYGSVDAIVDQAAARQGLRLVMPWSDSESGNIVDSKDTESGVTATGVERNVVPEIRRGAIIAMHDGEGASAQLVTQALPGIVDRMDAAHLCSSVDIRADATGGVLAGSGTHGSNNS